MEQKQHGKRNGVRGKTTQISKIINIMKNRVENILDTEMTWLMFMSDAARGDDDSRMRYRRINPGMAKDPPKLDDVKMLPNLRAEIQSTIKYGEPRKQIEEIARQLVASCFYVEVPHLPLYTQDFDTCVFGKDLLYPNSMS